MNEKNIKKIYYSFKDFEKEIFPNSYKNELRESKLKHPNEFGMKLASEFLSNMRKEIE